MRFHVDIVDLDEVGLPELKDNYTDRVFYALRDVLLQVGIEGTVSIPETERKVYIGCPIMGEFPLRRPVWNTDTSK